MNQCEIVRDLLPLYIEDMASQGSKDFIQEHLNHCNSCREAYQRMVAPTPPPTPQREEWKIALQKVEKKEKRRKILIWILSLLVILSMGAPHLKHYFNTHGTSSLTTTGVVPEDILKLCPTAIPTEEELGFLTWGSTIPILTNTDRIIPEEAFASYRDRLIPSDGQIGDISGWKHTLTIDYFLEGQRIMLCYRDENEDGTFDTLEKLVNPYYLKGEANLFYSATYSTRTATTRYEMHKESP